jgi:hypothetical protein
MTIPQPPEGALNSSVAMAFSGQNPPELAIIARARAGKLDGSIASLLR